jgi:hypothetical protein
LRTRTARVASAVLNDRCITKSKALQNFLKYVLNDRKVMNIFKS